MSEFRIAGEFYRSKDLSARDQYKLLRDIDPILPALYGMEFGLRLPELTLKDLAKFLSPISRLSDDESSKAFKACVAASEKFEENEWGNFKSNMRLNDLFYLVINVVGDNFATYFTMARPDYIPISSDPIQYTPVTMPEGKDWLMRPVIAKLCSYESLVDGTLKIEHVLEMNCALDVSEENEARMRKAVEKANK